MESGRAGERGGEGRGGEREGERREGEWKGGQRGERKAPGGTGLGP
jgi:hypothetical protein